MAIEALIDRDGYVLDKWMIVTRGTAMLWEQIETMSDKGETEAGKSPEMNMIVAYLVLLALYSSDNYSTGRSGTPMPLLNDKS